MKIIFYEIYANNDEITVVKHEASTEDPGFIAEYGNSNKEATFNKYVREFKEDLRDEADQRFMQSMILNEKEFELLKLKMK
jgi:hypothetical protein